MTKLADKVPFIRVNHLGKDKKVLTNIFGESFVLKNDEFNQYASGELSENSALYKELDKKFFIKKDAEDFINTQIGEYQKRNKLNFIGPTLHIIVLTKGCNHQCKYCHAAADYRYTDDGLQMSKKTAEKTVDIILQSPNKSLTIEFQGGEPIANMAVIDHIIKYTEQQNKKTKKDINYALVSNLTMIDEEILEMLFSYPNLSISTSIDGDKKTHDFNRLIIGKGKNVSSFDEVANKIRLIRKWEKKKGKKILGGAMGVITKKTLPRYKELVDTYIELGFDSIFLKKMNAIGFGENSKSIIGYSNDKLLEFYNNYFNYLIEKYKEGVFIRDGFLNITLSKIMDPENTNFMDLRSPCGAGIGQIAYDYTGKIYTCDEGRMVDNDTFQIGTVDDSLEDLVQNEIVGVMMDSSTVESLPCDVCAYAPYCGVCPIESYQARGNVYTNQVFDEHCSFFMYLFDWVFKRLSGDKESIEYNFLISQVKK